MDENERARREEIEAKEKRIYDKMDELRKELKEAISDAKSEAKSDLKEEATKREEADRRIYQKIDAEKDAMAKRLTDTAEALRKKVDDLEEKLETRDREIENHSQERDQEHDKTLTTMKQAYNNVREELDDHVKNERVHNKLHSIQTINEMQNQRNLPPPTYMSRSAAQPVAQPELETAPADQTSADQWDKMGVPWYANPRWIAAVVAAITGGVAAVWLLIEKFGG